MGGLHWLGIIAALVTAAVHLILGIRIAPGTLGITTHWLADRTRRVESVLRTRRGGDQ